MHDQPEIPTPKPQPALYIMRLTLMSTEGIEVANIFVKLDHWDKVKRLLMTTINDLIGNGEFGDFDMNIENFSTRDEPDLPEAEL